MLAMPGRAEARVQRDLDYRYEQVWGTLVRLLHVDYRYPVDEQDEPHGYVLFRYVEYGRRHAASVELVRLANTESRVRLVVQVEGAPSHLEAAILDDLERKLRAEIGRPTRTPDTAAAPREPGSAPAQPSTVPRLRDRPEDERRPRGDRNPPAEDAAPREGDAPPPESGGVRSGRRS